MTKRSGAQRSDIGRISRGKATPGLKKPPGGVDNGLSKASDSQNQGGSGTSGSGGDGDSGAGGNNGAGNTAGNEGAGAANVLSPDMMVVNGGMHGLQNVLHNNGLDKSDSFALQVVPWVWEHLRMPVKPLFEYEEGPFMANVENRFGAMLDEHYATYGQYPPFAYIDNDRFAPRRAFWDWALRDLPEGVMRYGDPSRSVEDHLEAAADWYDWTIRAMANAVYARDAQTKLSAWGQPTASAAHWSGYSDDLLSGGTRAYDNLDFVMPNVYLERGMSTVSIEVLKERTDTVVRLAAQMKPGAPNYVTVRLVYPHDAIEPSTRHRPVSAEKMRAIAEAARDAGADGVFIWEHINSHEVQMFVPEALAIIEDVFSGN